MTHWLVAWRRKRRDTVTISGAYVLPAYRGRRVAVALLDAALRNYQACGMRLCAVNFESFNPEAAPFWMKYFEPVCLSVVRVPEAPGAALSPPRMNSAIRG